MVELLFPEKAAARRADLEKQLAAERKRSASRVQEEGIHQLHSIDIVCTAVNHVSHQQRSRTFAAVILISVFLDPHKYHTCH